MKLKVEVNNNDKMLAAFKAANEYYENNAQFTMWDQDVKCGLSTTNDGGVKWVRDSPTPNIAMLHGNVFSWEGRRHSLKAFIGLLLDYNNFTPEWGEVIEYKTSKPQWRFDETADDQL